MGGTLMFVRMHENAELPEKAFGDDAGFDLALPETEVFEPGETRIVPLGVGVQFYGQFGLLTARSSTLPRYDLLVHLGIVDTGYEGELKAVIKNLAETTRMVQAGTRLVQLVPVANQSINCEPVWVNPPGSVGSGRGSGGFGSTG